MSCHSIEGGGDCPEIYLQQESYREFLVIIFYIQIDIGNTRQPVLQGNTKCHTSRELIKFLMLDQSGLYINYLLSSIGPLCDRLSQLIKCYAQ